MNLIISPWIFYFIGVSGNIQKVFIVLTMILSIYILFINDDISIKAIVFAIIFGIMAALIPSKEASYQMAAASICTTDNINAVINSGKNLIDYIVESIEIVIDKENKENE